MREELKKIDIKGMTKIVVIAIILYWTLNNLGIIWSLISKILIIFSPFILGACLAFILNIPMNFFEKNISKIKNKKGKRRFSQKFTKVISLCLAIILIIIIFVLIIKLIVPELLSVLGMLIENIPLYADEVYEILKNSTKDMPDINQIIEKTNINLEELKQQAVGIITNILTSSIAFIGNIISAVTNFVIAIIFAVYILAGKHKLKEQAQKLLYAYIKREKAEKIIEIGRVSRDTFKNFIIGQCTEATILGVLCILGMLILKIPYAISIGVLIGVTALVPIVGAFLGIIIGAILIASVAPVKVITFVAFVLILQQIEGNLIYPKVMGDSVGLPGIWVLVAVTIGGSLFGILGMLIRTSNSFYNIHSDKARCK